MLVRQEQHSYRDGDHEVRMALWDKALSDRHRTWGSKIQCTDIDQIVTLYPYKESEGMTALESMSGEGYAIVEYKYINELRGTNWIRKNRSQIDSLGWVCGKCEIPLFYCFYERDDWSVFVVSMNDSAKEWEQKLWSAHINEESGGVLLNEAAWVYWLHRVRGIKPRPARLMKQYNTIIKAKTWGFIL